MKMIHKAAAAAALSASLASVKIVNMMGVTPFTSLIHSSETRKWIGMRSCSICTMERFWLVGFCYSHPIVTNALSPTLHSLCKYSIISTVMIVPHSCQSCHLVWATLLLYYPISSISNWINKLSSVGMYWFMKTHILHAMITQGVKQGVAW